MAKRSNKIPGRNLIFRLTKEGLYIAGDKRGLRELASVLQWVAEGKMAPTHI